MQLELVPHCSKRQMRISNHKLLAGKQQYCNQHNLCWINPCRLGQDNGCLLALQISHLAAAGHRVIAPDLPGFGASDKPAGLEPYKAERVVQVGCLAGTSNCCNFIHD
jgi:hypothetical protein